MILYMIMCGGDIIVRNTEKEARRTLVREAGDQEQYVVTLHRETVNPTRTTIVELANGLYRPKTLAVERIDVDGKHWYKCLCCDVLVLPSGGPVVCGACVEKRVASA